MSDVAIPKHPGDVVRQRDELRAQEQRKSEHCGVLWCDDCARLFDDLKVAIKAASPWTGSALCWCRADDAPDCSTPSCIRLRELLR